MKPKRSWSDGLHKKVHGTEPNVCRYGVLDILMMSASTPAVVSKNNIKEII